MGLTLAGSRGGVLEDTSVGEGVEGLRVLDPGRSSTWILKSPKYDEKSHTEENNNES